MQESKEKISSRMLKSASRLWGFHDTQSESSFDPVVGLILGALANELAKISTDIHSVESRILEKLVQLLTPEPITGATPAHAIATARPYESKQYVNQNYQFYLNKRFVVPGEHKTDERPVFFSPTGRYKIFDGQLRYLVSASKIYQFNDDLEKEITAMARMSQNVSVSELWFGLDLNENIESLKQLSLFFDLRNAAYDESFYKSLAKANWKLADKSISFEQGLQDRSEPTDKFDNELLKEWDINAKNINHINRYYKKRFQTLVEDVVISKQIQESNLPNQFYQWYSNNDLQNMQDNLVWLKVEFPQVLPTDVVDDLFCAINCFPVLNRRLEEFTQSARDIINIIPLITDDIFFDVKAITSSNGKKFLQKSFSGINEIDDGSYIVRNGGVGRFDSRDAAELINYLLELLRDESAAFSIIGTDMISTELKELNQTITRLEHRLSESKVNKKNVPYLLLKSTPGDDTFFVEFWTTNGDFANKIKAGEALFIYDGGGLSADSLKFVTPSYGGRESMNADERVNAYRKSILSHGRVVTREDIRALCYEHFGNVIKNVEIKKGFQTGQLTNNGIVQTLDIYIYLDKNTEELKNEELEFIKKDLLLKLEEQSANILPYRCFINQYQ